MRRRVGGALLAGVTALGVAGVAALASGGVADAATSVSASLPAGTSATSIPGTVTPTAANAASFNVTVSGAVSAGDEIVLTLSCPTTGTIAWTAAPTVAATLNGVAETTGWAPATTALSSSGNCGTADDTLTLVAGSGAATTSSTASTVISLTAVELTTDGANPGAVGVSGKYLSLGAAAVTFTVPSPATITWFGVTSNVPAVNTSGTSAQSVSNVTISQPASLTGGFTSPTAPATDKLTMTLSGATFASTPTFSVVPSGAATVASVALATTTTTNDTAVVTFSAVTPTDSANYTFSGLSITPTTSGGPVSAKLTLTNGAATTDMFLSVPIATQLSSQVRIYGQTADATVAQEFMAAFPVSGATHPTSAVLATDVDPFDALSAAYLESQLGTGLLITPPTSLGTDALNALRTEGITTVYVVGGPDAITPAVITQLQNTPAYNLGGVTETGSNIKVVGPIYGQTAADTAQQIAQYFGTAYGSLPQVSGAYSATGGAFNDTTGTASTSGPTTSTPTAFVIASTDWQDATTLGPIAYAYRLPVVLTDASALSSQAQTALTTLGVKQVIVVGGQLALSNNVVTALQALNGGISVLRIAGIDYTDTATQLAKFETSTTQGLAWDAGTPKGFLVSHGDYWSDALGAAAIGGNASFSINGGPAFGYEPILTTQNPTTPGSYIGGYLTGAKAPAAQLNVLGGPLAVTSSVVTSLQGSLAAG